MPRVYQVDRFLNQTCTETVVPMVPKEYSVTGAIARCQLLDLTT